MRKNSWVYVGPLESEPDRVLGARANQLHQRYSLLKLSLTRFAWGGADVEKRARHMVAAWADNVVRDCVRDAESLSVESERYFRNLLQQLPEWIAQFLVAIIINDRATRSLLPRLNLRALPDFGENEKLRFLTSLFRPGRRSAIPPDEVAIFVPLSNSTLARAWARWFAAGGDTRGSQRAGHVGSVPRSPVRSEGMGVEAAPLKSATTINIASPHDGLASARHEEVPHSHSINPVPIPVRQFWLNAEQEIADGRLDSDSVIDFVKEASRTQRIMAWADGALTSALRRLDHLPVNAAPRVQALITDQLRCTGFLALRVVARGQDGALDEMRQLPRRLKNNVVNSLHLSVRVHLCSSLLGTINPDWDEIYTDSQILLDGLSSLFSTTLHELPSHLLPKVLARWRRLGPGTWRTAILDRLVNLSADDLRSFIKSAKSLDDHWSKLPLAAREALLDAWTRNRSTFPDLPEVAAVACPSFALDAVRWGDDPEALARIILSRSSVRAMDFLRRQGGRKDHPGWRLALQQMRRAGTVPMPLIEQARRDPKLLHDLVEEVIPAFRNVPLDGLDPSAFLIPALRLRWLGERLDAIFSQDELRRALSKVRDKLSARPRLLAAAEIAVLIGVRHGVALRYLSTRPFPDHQSIGTRFDSLYRSWTIPKRSGGTRLITSPVFMLKAIQRGLLDQVLQNAPCHRAATGFRRGLSVVDNAKPHVGRRVVLNVDIAGFFPSTRFWLIRRAVDVAMPKWASEVTRRFATDICACGGVLPIGAPTSPAIANIVLLSADKAIAKVAKTNKLSYTRYADDITLSGENPLHILPFVRDVLKGLGYEIDPRKTNIFRRGRRQVVTGLVVNDKVSVPRSVRKRLRAAVHRATKDEGTENLTWHKCSMSIQELEGRIAFTGVAHPVEAAGLAQKLRNRRSRQ